MAKTKRKHLAALAAKRDSRSVENKKTVSSQEEIELFADYTSWVEVKKQRIVIIIPSLPTSTEETTKQVERAKEEHTKFTPITVKRNKYYSSINPKTACRNRKKVNRKPKGIKNQRRLEINNKRVDSYKAAAEIQNNKSNDGETSVALAVLKSAAPSLYSRQKNLASNEEPVRDKGCEVAEFNLSEERVMQPKQTMQEHPACVEERCQQTEEILPVQKSSVGIEIQMKPSIVNSQESLPVHITSPYSGSGYQTSNRSEELENNCTHSEKSSRPVNLYAIVGLQASISQDVANLSQKEVAGCQLHGPSTNFLQFCSSSKHPIMALSQCSNQCVGNEGRLLESNSMPSNYSPINESTGRGNRYCGLDSYLNNVALGFPTKRALLLKKRLNDAGGLRNWLLMRGLRQFVDIFEREKIAEQDLLQLTMATLKEMGAFPIGPRRKLINAINELGQPYCFRAS